MFGTTDPVLRTPNAVVCGLNSGRPWRHQGGRLDPTRLGVGRADPGRCAPPGALRIVVCHHHLAGAPWRASRKFPLKHRDTVLRTLAAAGAELVLGGHIHQSTAVERHAFEALADDDRRSARSRHRAGLRPAPSRPARRGQRAPRRSLDGRRDRDRDADLAERQLRADARRTRSPSLGVVILADPCHHATAVSALQERGLGIRASRGAMMAFAVVTGTAALLALAGSVAGAASSRPVIAFGSERGGPVRIAVVGLRPGQRVLPSSSAGMDVEPSWSPNGSRLAIATSDASGQDFDIATIAPNGAPASGSRAGQPGTRSPPGHRTASGSPSPATATGTSTSTSFTRTGPACSS